MDAILQTGFTNATFCTVPFPLNALTTREAAYGEPTLKEICLKASPERNKTKLSMAKTEPWCQ
jgi:hypothetical protein